MKKISKRTRLAFYLFFAFIGFAVFHNFSYYILRFEEALFFSLAIFSFIGFVIYFVYGTIFAFLKKTPEDWWKLSYLGFLGFLGFIPMFGANLYGFYGFFGLLGFRKND